LILVGQAGDSSPRPGKRSAQVDRGPASSCR